MKTKKQKKSNLKVSLLLLLLAAVLLISSTYAWFISNTNVTVSTLQVNVESVQGIQISVDAITWQPAIDKAALATVGTTGSTNPSAINQLPEVMKPVSTIGAVDETTGTMGMHLGSVATLTHTPADGSPAVDYYALTATKQTDVNGSSGNYIAFDMFLKYDGASDTTIYARPGSGVAYASATSKKLEYASRIAFIKEGWVASTAANAATTAQGKKYSSADTANCGIFIWEPNYDLHNTAGTTLAKGQYNVDLTESTEDPIPYAGIKSEIDQANDVHFGNPKGEGQKYWIADTTSGYPNYFANVTPNIKTKQNFDTNTALFTIKPGITKVRVYLWIEGQDVDCINEASGTDIKFDLKFTTAA